MDIYERYGRKQEQLEDAVSAYETTYELLKRLLSGDIDLKDVRLTPDGWDIEESLEPGTYEAAKRKTQEEAKRA